MNDGKTILYLKGIRLSVVFTMLMKILMVKVKENFEE